MSDAMECRWTNLGDLADRSLDQSRPAVVDLAGAEPKTYTHGEIDQLANGVATYLLARGLQRGDAVAIMALNRAEYVIAYFGIMRAGLIAVPVNIKQPRETIDFVLDDAGVVLAFTDADRAAWVKPGVPVVSFDDPGPAGWAACIRPAAFDAVVPGPAEIGQMLYTSGSTGRAKGVPLSHAGQLWAVQSKTNNGQAAPERVIVAQPLFHMNGLFLTKTVFATNGLLVILPSFDVRAYIEALGRYKITSVGAVPTMLARVIKETDLLAQQDLSAIRKLLLGSAPITLGLLQRIQATFPQATISLGYGTTEAGPAVFGPHPDGIPTPTLSLGYPLANAELRLVDGPDADYGVLEMRNKAVMAGYHNLPERSAKVLHDGWYYSGDVMRRDANGFFFFVGRADDMFVCAGENIYPGEVEKMLESHPAIQQAAVVPLPDEERSQVPVAFLVLRPGEALSVEQVKRYALEHGPAYQHPRRVLFLPELPWAGTNKVDRNMLIREATRLEAAGAWSA
jgi:acyl-CoA synthetase (AMP-forming)/AMP-acid ligase II